MDNRIETPQQREFVPLAEVIRKGDVLEKTFNDSRGGEARSRVLDLSGRHCKSRGKARDQREMRAAIGGWKMVEDSSALRFPINIISKVE